MKVISVNIGKVKEYSYRGKMIKSGIDKSPVEEIYLGNEDVDNDDVIDRKYHGGIDQACYLYGTVGYEHWKKQYPELNWHYGLLGDNITIDGLDEKHLIENQTYQLGEVIVQITKPRNPCYKLGLIMGSVKVLKEFWHAPYPGVYIRIIQNGKVKAGDEMTLLKDCVGPSMLDIYEGKRKSKGV